jgi:hypothetical protein
MVNDSSSIKKPAMAGQIPHPSKDIFVTEVGRAPNGQMG